MPYRHKKQIDPFFSKPGQFRAVASRYGQRDDHILASVQLVSIRVRLRKTESATQEQDRHKNQIDRFLTKLRHVRAVASR